ncbi:hypothetical protein OROGR_005962 [Orobanche gracilis]
MLLRRGLVTDPICHCCGLEEETIQHALLQCPDVKKIWFASNLGLRIDYCPCESFQIWLMHVMNLMDQEAKDFVFNILWVIWWRRNEWVHKKRKLDVDQMLTKLSSIFPPANPEYSVPPNDSSSLEVYSYWGAIAHVDVSVKNNLGTGGGLVIKDQSGTILACATQYLPEELNPTLAEADILRWAINLIINLGFISILIVTDCQQLQQVWMKKRRSCSYLEEIVQECLDEAKYFTNCHLVFRRRVHNLQADFMASLAFDVPNNIWLEEFPIELSELSQNDVPDASFS